MKKPTLIVPDIKYYTIRDAARFAGVTVPTIHYHIKTTHKLRDAFLYRDPFGRPSWCIYATDLVFFLNGRGLPAQLGPRPIQHQRRAIEAAIETYWGPRS